MQFPLTAVLGLSLLVSELLLGATRRSGGSAKSEDKSSLRVLWIVILGSIFLGFRVARWQPAAALPNREAIACLAVALFAIGIALRWAAIIRLGRFFTVDVAIASDHQLVESGPYRYVRHPSYTGALLAFGGFALAVGNWAAFLVMTVPITIAFIHRIHVEERALTEALGERYVRYCARTKRLVPFVY